eukprot:269628_1
MGNDLQASHIEGETKEFFNDWRRRDDLAHEKGAWNRRNSHAGLFGRIYCVKLRDYVRWHNNWRARDNYASANDMWGERFSYGSGIDGGRYYCCYTSAGSY